MNIYDFLVKDTLGEEISLSTYKGKVLLIDRFMPTTELKKLENIIKELIENIN